MNIAESINKARERGLSDKEILEAIKKQNPGKEEFFKKAEERGASATQILNETINQNERKETVSLSQEKIPSSLPKKPTEESKLWMRIFITFGLSVIAALSFTFLYRVFFIPRLEPIDPEIIVKEIYHPRATEPLIKLYPEKDDIIRFPITANEELLMHLRRIIREEKNGDIIRIIVEDQREGVQSTRVVDLENFFDIFQIKYPERFFEKIEKDFNLFVCTTEARSKIGFVAKFSEENREEVEWNIMRPWEKTIEKDFRNFFAFWNEEVPEDEGDLLSIGYQGELPREVSIRYREGSGGMGIYYTIINDRIIFGTSAESIKILIERHNELNK